MVGSVSPSSPLTESVDSTSSSPTSTSSSATSTSPSASESVDPSSAESAATSSSDDDECWEICCNPRGTLTDAATATGLRAKRLTLGTGYDIMKEETVRKARKHMNNTKPRRAWVSIPCTPMVCHSELQPVAQPTTSRGTRKTGESRALGTCFAYFENMVEPRRHWYFEWPNRCQGWRLPELVEFRSYCIRKGCPVYEVRIDGCMYGLLSKQKPFTYLQKPWNIWTTDPTFVRACGRRCRETHPHT
ncbi:hypothetical protein N9L68_02630 [bacterium]|nr:hypothetical protein [bacterium]